MPSLEHKRGNSNILSYQKSNLLAVKKIKEYGIKTTKWRGYSELAWAEPVIASPEEYAEETELFSKTIKEHSKVEPKTLLHLGCGEDGNDYTFKKHFKVTGVDISEGMLEIARNCNPEG